jgi:hypothetical protein
MVRAVRESPVEDLDASGVLALLEDIGFPIVSHAAELPRSERDAVTQILTKAVGNAVATNASIPGFAAAISAALEPWVRDHGLAGGAPDVIAKALDQAFGGVCLMRTPEEQREIVGTLVEWVERECEIAWRRSPGPVRAYSPGMAAAVGDEIVHPTFGRGEVVGVLEGKVEVRFGDAVKRLAAGVGKLA